MKQTKKLSLCRLSIAPLSLLLFLSGCASGSLNNPFSSMDNEATNTSRHSPTTVTSETSKSPSQVAPKAENSYNSVHKSTLTPVDMVGTTETPNIAPPTVGE